MEVVADLARCDGYEVFAEGNRLGRVEEIWLGEWDETTAVVTRLNDGRRGLLLATDVAGVWPSSRFLTVASTGRLLQLEPPHLEPEVDGGRQPVAAWRTSGEVIDLEHPRATAEETPVEKVERPLWQSLAGLYAGVAVIVGSLIALDFLLSYLVTGSPPY